MQKYDLIVVGGGFGGVGAAVAAAREGLKVLLIEKSNALGGAANLGLVTPFMYYRTITGEDADGNRTYYYLCRGIFEEIVNELKKGGRSDNLNLDTNFDSEYLKLILNRFVLESGVELLYDVTVVSAEREGNRINSVTVHSKGQDVTFEADYFIDATGDANLVAMTGFPFRLGREPDRLCQPMTLCFRLAGVDTEEFWRIHKFDGVVNALYKKLQAEGKIKNPRENVLAFRQDIEGVVHFNTTRVVRLNPTDIFDVTKAEIEAREQMYEMLDFLKTNFECFKNAHVVTSATEIGIRESRMIEGEYTVTGKELMDCVPFEDSIATGNYDIDIHNPEGTGTSHYYFPRGKYYRIPYGVLVPKNSENLLVAGRCVSADHEAQASIRIMPIVCCLGQAAGTAIAVAQKQQKGVKDIDVKELQANLLRNGAVID